MLKLVKKTTITFPHEHYCM